MSIPPGELIGAVIAKELAAPCPVYQSGLKYQPFRGVRRIGQSGLPIPVDPMLAAPVADVEVPGRDMSNVPRLDFGRRIRIPSHGLASPRPHERLDNPPRGLGCGGEACRKDGLPPAFLQTMAPNPPGASPVSSLSVAPHTSGPFSRMCRAFRAPLPLPAHQSPRSCPPSASSSSTPCFRTARA